MWIGIAASSVVTMLSVFFYWQSARENEQLSLAYKEKPTALDSTKSLPLAEAQISTEPSPKVVTDSSFVFTYKVKSGDYPAKLARIFYDDWKMYKKIEADNNLQQPYILKAGQPLLIKLHR